jgi:hypothetical protein
MKTKIYVPANGQILEEELDLQNFKVNLFPASSEMSERFGSKDEGTLRLKDETSIYQIKNELLQYCLKQECYDFKIAFFVR